MSAWGPTNAGSFRRFCVAVRALSLALVAVLILPSLSLADHHHPGEARSVGVSQTSSTPDGSTDTSPDHCLPCHVLCSCHAGLPAADAITTVVRAISLIEPVFSTDRQLASALDKRLQRPPRA